MELYRNIACYRPRKLVRESGLEGCLWAGASER